MVEKIDLPSLADGVYERWKSATIGSVNGNGVRFRVMENVTADWHAHDESDELFLVLSGVVNIDTEEDSQALSAGELLIVPARTMHRARVEGRATLIVIDAIQG